MAQHAGTKTRPLAAADAARAQTRVEVVNAVTPSSSRETSPAGTRSIVGFIGVAVAFALISQEIKKETTPTSSGVAAQSGALSEGGTIILGGFAAAALLSIVAKAGDAGRQLAVGLAAVTMVSSVAVYGAPVWKLIGSATGAGTRRGVRATPTTPSQALGGAQAQTSISTPLAPTRQSTPLPII